MKKFIKWGLISLAIVIVIVMIASIGGGNETEKQEAYKKGYDAGYKEGYEKAKEAWSQKAEPTPAPSPPFASKKVDIVSHRSRISSGYYEVVGEVQNNTDRKVTYVKIIATFYDSNGQVLATGSSYAEIKDLEPGQKSPFEVSNYPNKESSQQIVRYDLQVTYD